MQEFRIDYGPGYRIYFGRYGNLLVILLAGGTKKRQQRDIHKAITYWVDFKRRMKNGPSEKGTVTMPLTRSFKETVRERAQRDPEFRALLLQEAIECFLEGDLDTGKIVLRDYINATLGFEQLAELLDKSPKSLMRMLGPKGNPAARNLFDIIARLQEKEGIHFTVRPVR